VPVPIVGLADLVTADEVIEFKCSQALWDQGRVEASPQAALYAWACARLRGFRPRVRFIVLNPRTRALQELTTWPNGAGVQLFELAAAATWRGIVRGEFPRQCQRCAACLDGAVSCQKPALELRLP
jgi:hypothetical protein